MKTHRSINISPCWPHEPATTIGTWTREPVEQVKNLAGRTVLQMHAGPVMVCLNPTPAELRRLAAALLAVADAQDRIDGMDKPASLDGLTVTEIIRAEVAA